jgi:hypothetical protein
MYTTEVTAPQFRAASVARPIERHVVAEHVAGHVRRMILERCDLVVARLRETGVIDAWTTWPTSTTASGSGPRCSPDATAVGSPTVIGVSGGYEV